jgi:hypothetical protein
MEFSQNRTTETFDEILLDTPCRGHKDINHLVLTQKLDNLAQARGNQIGCESEE